MATMKRNRLHADDKRLLTPADTARQLGVSQMTLAKWRSSGRYGLRFVKVGRLVRYRSEDVEAFIISHRR